MSSNSEQFKNLGGTIRLTLLFSGLFAFIVLIGYIVSGGWNDTQKWGAFGDYVGGLLNPIFAFVNVIILVVISYQLALMEDGRSQRDSDLQEHLGQLQPRYAAIQEIAEYQYQINTLIEDQNQVEKLEKIRLRLRVTLLHHRMLFPDLKFNNKILFAVFDILIKTSKTWYELFSKDDNEIEDGDAHIEELKEAKKWLIEANKMVNSEISQIQKEMMLFIMNPNLQKKKQ